jgi:phage-related holin
MSTISAYMLEIKMMSAKKLLLIVLLSVPLASVLAFIEKYIYADWSFLISLFILIFLDTVLGIAKAFMTNSIQSKKFGDIFLKIVLYAVFLIVVHVLMSFTINGNHPVLVDYIDDFAMSSLMLREGWSIVENIALIKPDLLPKSILKKLKAFDSETGEAIKD